jgi:hypothetical protein
MPPTERHSRAALEIRRIYKPDPEGQVAALLIVLERPSRAAAGQAAQRSGDADEAEPA